MTRVLAEPVCVQPLDLLMSPPGRCICSLPLPPMASIPFSPVAGTQWLGHSLTVGLTGWGLESNSGPDHVSHSAFRSLSPPLPLAQPSHPHLREGPTLYPRPCPLLPLREMGERPCGVERTPFSGWRWRPWIAKEPASRVLDLVLAKLICWPHLFL